MLTKDQFSLIWNRKKLPSFVFKRHILQSRTKKFELQNGVANFFLGWLFALERRLRSFKCTVYISSATRPSGLKKKALIVNATGGSPWPGFFHHVHLSFKQTTHFEYRQPADTSKSSYFKRMEYYSRPNRWARWPALESYKLKQFSSESPRRTQSNRYLSTKYIPPQNLIHTRVKTFKFKIKDRFVPYFSSSVLLRQEHRNSNINNDVSCLQTLTSYFFDIQIFQPLNNSRYCFNSQ